MVFKLLADHKNRLLLKLEVVQNMSHKSLPLYWWVCQTAAVEWKYMKYSSCYCEMLQSTVKFCKVLPLAICQLETVWLWDPGLWIHLTKATEVNWILAEVYFEH